MVRYNAAQQQAITAHGHLEILACPGAGKTATMIGRLSYQLGKAPGSRALATTFSRAAAHELLHRAGAQGVQASRIRIGTFHTLAFAQASRQSKGIRIVDQGEAETLVARAIAEAKSALTVEEALMLLEGKYTGEFGNAERDVIDIYAGLLERHNATDFNTLVRSVVESMEDGKTRPWPVELLIVDEAQDIDELQLRWVLVHARAGTAVTIVGDDDQSIYGFRDALGYDAFRLFHDATNATRVVLGTNYRSFTEILVPATQLIGRNEHRADKEISSSRGTGGCVHLLKFDSLAHEAAAVAEHISLNDPGTWAVLARTNRRLDAFEAALVEAGVSVHRLGGKSIFDNRMVSVLFGILRHAQTGEPLGFENATSEIDRLENIAEERRSMLKSKLLATAQFARANHANRTDEVIAMCAGFISSLATEELDGKAVVAAGKALQRFNGTLLARMNLAKRKPRIADGDNTVKLMTMHASKGLEFKRVWVACVESGVIPSPDSDLEEERRLLYVAMTRAQNELYISFQRVQIEKARRPGGPSQFLYECQVPFKTVPEGPNGIAAAIRNQTKGD